MLGLAHRLGAAFAVLALGAAAPAAAQESFDQGKTPAQLYASDCAICHKSPRGLSRAGGMFGLNNFLREHYTASRQAAAAIAAYLQQVDSAPAPARSRSTRRKPSEPKLPPARPTAAKSSDTKPADAKPADAKASDGKPPAGEQAEAKAAPKDGAKPAKPAKDAEPDKKAD